MSDPVEVAEELYGPEGVQPPAFGLEGNHNEPEQPKDQATVTAERAMGQLVGEMIALGKFFRDHHIQKDLEFRLRGAAKRFGREKFFQLHRMMPARSLIVSAGSRLSGEELDAIRRTFTPEERSAHDALPVLEESRVA